MKRLVIIAVGLATAVSALSFAEDAKRDTDLIRGTWSAVAEFDEDGKAKEIKPDDPQHFRFAFTADKVATILKSRTLEGTYKIEPSTAPKEIDVVRKIRGENATFKGIYALDGDKFRFCLAGTGNDRPKKFQAGEGIEFAVEMKRVKK